MEPAAVSKVMQGLWDRIAPTYNTFTGDGMMAPATELIIAAVQQHRANRRGVRRGRRSAEIGYRSGSSFLRPCIAQAMSRRCSHTAAV